MLPRVGIEPGPPITSDSKCNTPFWTNWVFVCKAETLGSLNNHALLILTKSKSKNQVMHEQKFKDTLSSTCPLSSKRRVLNLESEVHERPTFYPHLG